MIVRGVTPDKFTFPFVIKACLVLGEIKKGKEVHGMAIKTRLSKDLVFENGLMDFYFECEDFDSGRKVFDKMRVRSVVSWTTMLMGLLDCGELEAARGVFERIPVRNVVSWTAMINENARSRPSEAFELFKRMQVDNVMPNEFTLVGLLVVCTELGNLMWGRRIHKFIIENGLELNVFLGTALIDMYSKCGSIEDAMEVFLENWDIIVEEFKKTIKKQKYNGGRHWKLANKISVIFPPCSKLVYIDAESFDNVMQNMFGAVGDT